jgi:hypothetical protein
MPFYYIKLLNRLYLAFSLWLKSWLVVLIGNYVIVLLLSI